MIEYDSDDQADYTDYHLLRVDWDCHCRLNEPHQVPDQRGQTNVSGNYRDQPFDEIQDEEGLVRGWHDLILLIITDIDSGVPDTRPGTVQSLLSHHIR